MTNIVWVVEEYTKYTEDSDFQNVVGIYTTEEMAIEKGKEIQANINYDMSDRLGGKNDWWYMDKEDRDREDTGLGVCQWGVNVYSVEVDK